MPIIDPFGTNGVAPSTQLNQLVQQVNDLTAPTWFSYSGTFALTSSGTTPTIGNGVVVAQYRWTGNSNTVQARVKITIGTTTSLGTGVLFFSLPINAHVDEVGGPIGTAWALDTGVKEAGGICKLETTSTFRIGAAPSTAGAFSNWTNLDPYTWGSTDIIRARVEYQAA